MKKRVKFIDFTVWIIKSNVSFNKLMGKTGKLLIGLMVPLVNLTGTAVHDSHCVYQHPINESWGVSTTVL